MKNTNILIQSKKHWLNYFFPIVLIILTVTVIIIDPDYWVLLGSIVIIVALSWIIKLLTIKWILLEDSLIIKKGLMPWKKSRFEIPIEDIYEAFHQKSFWSYIFGYGHISIRRTEGSTTSIKTTYMNRYKQMTQSINSLTIEIKKRTHQPKIENEKAFSVSDELLKLSELKEKGIITEEEFIEQKEKILNKN